MIYWNLTINFELILSKIKCQRKLVRTYHDILLFLLLYITETINIIATTIKIAI